MHIPSAISFFPALLPLFLPLTAALLPTHLIYEAAKGTWYENLAVRASGSILITEITAPNLYLINPLSPNPKPTLLHNFSSALWLLGISETSPDVFQLVAANGTLATLSPAPGSNRIYQVAFPPGSDTPEIKLTATLPEAEFLNGMTTLNPTTVLVADSKKGVVWATDIETGISRIAISDPLLLPTSSRPLGINGLHFHDQTLYFTNTALNLFAKIPIHPDGTAAGSVVNISHAPADASYDDFAIGKHGDAFLVTGTGNSLEEVGLRGQPQVIVAGNLNSTELAEPTSAAFGRGKGERGLLYVTTGGGLLAPVNGNETIGGQLVAVDTRGVRGR